MRERIFRPLGLGSTGINEADGQTDSANGYRWQQHDGLIPGVRISAAAHARADVGIHSTALDLARWDALLDGDHFLTAASRRTMFSAAHLKSGAVVPYGLGWFIRPWRGRWEIEHDGGFRTGFSSTIARYPEDSLTIIVLTNRQSAHAYSIVRGLMGLFDGDFTPISRMPAMRGDWPRERAAVRRTFDAIAHGRRAPDLDRAALPLTGVPLAEMRQGLNGYAVPRLLGCRAVHRPPGWPLADRGTEVCFVRADSPAGAWWSFTFDRRHRITYFEPEE
jgi:CubicO group peptidase (beta-lactamase class C family)